MSKNSVCCICPANKRGRAVNERNKYTDAFADAAGQSRLRTLAGVFRRSVCSSSVCEGQLVATARFPLDTPLFVVVAMEAECGGVVLVVGSGGLRAIPNFLQIFLLLGLQGNPTELIFSLQKAEEEAGKKPT